MDSTLARADVPPLGYRDSHPRHTSRSRMRIALYSHDTMGLGHMRRNLLVARALAGSPLRASVLMIAGAAQANVFAAQRGVDCLTLPALGKRSDGTYTARSLGIPRDRLVAMRARSIRAALEEFDPDVFIVDTVPRGALGELEPTLDDLKRSGRTRCVLGLRDVLDDPTVVQREWSDRGNEAAIREYYDAVWVYGDAGLYDMAREYGFCESVTSKLAYTGYLDRLGELEAEAGRLACATPPVWSTDARVVACMFGGGQDGAHVAESFAQVDFAPETRGVIVTGPYMPPRTTARLHRAAERSPNLQVLEFLSAPLALLSCADRVVTMGGYNAVSEALSLEKRALIVPRVKPRREQLIRAERLSDRGLVDVCHPDDLTPHRLGDWIESESPQPPSARERLDFGGLARLPVLVDVLSPRRAAASLE